MSAFLSMRSRHFWLSAVERERGEGFMCVCQRCAAMMARCLLCACANIAACAVLRCRPIFARTDELDILPLDAFALILRLRS